VFVRVLFLGVWLLVLRGAVVVMMMRMVEGLRLAWVGRICAAGTKGRHMTFGFPPGRIRPPPGS